MIHNTGEFLLYIVPNSRITLSKIYTRRTSDKAVILQSCFLDVLTRHISKYIG